MEDSEFSTRKHVLQASRNELVQKGLNLITRLLINDGLKKEKRTVVAVSKRAKNNYYTSSEVQRLAVL